MITRFRYFPPVRTVNQASPEAYTNNTTTAPQVPGALETVALVTALLKARSARLSEMAKAEKTRRQARKEERVERLFRAMVCKQLKEQNRLIADVRAERKVPVAYLDQSEVVIDFWAYRIAHFLTLAGYGWEFRRNHLGIPVRHWENSEGHHLAEIF